MHVRACRRLLAAALGVVATNCAAGDRESASARAAGPTPPVARSAADGEVLILFDQTGPYAWLGELYATATANLVSHFASWRAEPVARYRAGELSRHAATFYIGSTYDEPLPRDFVDDVTSADRPVVWINDNIWQLANRPGFAARYGFLPAAISGDPVRTVRYKGRDLSRRADQGGIMTYVDLDPRRVAVLAQALRDDGRRVPWAIRAGNLTYVGEIPFAYTSEEDRYLAFCDLLFDVLAPRAPERHRALVRIEDVHALTPPAQLRAVADVLAEEGIPFSVAVVPTYLDPNGALGGVRRLVLGDAPEVVQALKYMVSRGGTLVMHGDTHQYGTQKNPYNGASVSDFEFYTAHLDDGGAIVMDGPVPDDSPAWARARAAEGLDVFRGARLPVPTIFEYPHYAGSATDSATLEEIFGAAYQRGLYFTGTLTGRPVDPGHSLGMFFPFAVRDVYGWKVLPENLGHYVPGGQAGDAPRTAGQIVRAAQANLVVRDGVASFFFHPMYEPSVLHEIVDGIRTAGYTFVAASSL
jgi:uncharacterized protein YdaL